MNETHTTQPFGPFFPLIFTVAKWICRLLHPVTVQGLENLPRHGALLVANHASNWDPVLVALKRLKRAEALAVRRASRSGIRSCWA